LTRVAHELEKLSPGSITGRAAYLLGVAWALRQAGNVGVDSDLSMGAGLSSSAALECAVKLALTDLQGWSVPRRELAVLASRAENKVRRRPYRDHDLRRQPHSRRRRLTCRPK
jgi:galactokinase